ELKCCGLVGTGISSCLSEIVDTRIRKRSSWFARQSIEHEVSRCAAGCEARVVPLFVIDHRGYFGSSSIFIDLLRNGSYQIFTEVGMVLCARGWAGRGV